MSYRVFIGVGHGGSDPGAVRYVREADANLNIALELRRLLEEYGVEVGMSRTVDENDDIYEEIREANAFGPDLAVEIHNNAGGGDGWECFIQTNQYGAKSKACAQAIETEVKAIGQKSRGLKTKVFGWTYNIKAPSVLLEGFFVDNWNDAKDFDTVEEQKKLAGAYARGILKYLDVTEKPPQKDPEVESYSVEVSGTATIYGKNDTEELCDALESLGYKVSVSENLADSPAPAVKEMKKGSSVIVKPGSRYYDYPDKIPNPIIYNRVHTVYSMSGNRVVIEASGIIVGAVHKDNLELV